MTESSGKKKLTIDLSLLANLSDSKSPSLSFDSKDFAKSPRNFEREVVGLGIVAAMNDFKDSNEAVVSAKSSRAAILVVSPRLHPIPSSAKSAAKVSDGPKFEKGKMELSESYTRVISHFGNSSIKKREYFDDKISGSYGACSYTVSSGVFPALPAGHGQDCPVVAPFQISDFLNSCHLCQKKLQGLDIFMYRGEKAFCSAECRHKQISRDEHIEKCGSETKKLLECSASPCSGPMLVLAGVAAA